MTIESSLLNGPLGFGAAPLGNMFRDIPEEEALATVEAAWDAGTRYFDTAPFYGSGLSEIRLGRVMSKKKRDEYILSTKVGRIIVDKLVSGPQEFGEKGTLFRFGRKNEIVYDYSAEGAERSIEHSLKRMSVDRIDFVWIHDIAQDFHGNNWLSVFDIAHKGAMKALDKMRDEGVIKGWGLGVNRIEPVELMLGFDDVKPDGTLLAGRYSLLDHSDSLRRLMPLAEKKNVQLVIGGPYSSGVLAGGTHFEYADAPKPILDKVAKIKGIAERHNVAIKAIALQFVIAHPAVVSVIPGASKPERIKEDHAALKVKVPDDVWQELRKENLVDPKAPLPIDK
ncbi:aldo/keto reductase [Rhizobium leguminosarum]|uniref:aldo/keto reductase n=1 Tax=Rhizobium leguminosarum TaxID=384 RepID=UPI001C93EC19|nr:aldo/keto reductase [Rhizobium leguminosarum]MBY5537717.1 aldo/keto reductase [Rhizobium leguminosarum]